MDDDWDCVVVGGGAAGLSAALVLGRARRRTLLLDRDGQSNRVAEHVGGLLGHDGTPPGELYARAREQLGAYDAVVLRSTRPSTPAPWTTGSSSPSGATAARCGRAR
jgi:thioredoxin reductase